MVGKPCFIFEIIFPHIRNFKKFSKCALVETRLNGGRENKLEQLRNRKTTFSFVQLRRQYLTCLCCILLVQYSCRIVQSINIRRFFKFFQKSEYLDN